MKNLSRLDVFIDGTKTGTLAMLSDGRAAFQYDAKWIDNGFELSPFDLPLESDVFIPKNWNCRGLWGVFEDSLPDAWGTLLMNRKLATMGIRPEAVNVLDRLSLIGAGGSGDMEYRPAAEMSSDEISSRSFDEIKEECDALLTGDVRYLDELFANGGSSGGARPKVYVKYQDEEWIVKFPLPSDGEDAGKIEYDYSILAEKCGIKMSETHLFESRRCAGYFGTKRFDRTGGGKSHVATAKGLLDLPFDMPSLDYLSLLQLTDILTIHDEEATEQMFRLACFNVFAHNQDDHSKNFSFMYDKGKMKWTLAPAYDLTYSTTAYDQHTTSVNGKGDPTADDLRAIIRSFSVPDKRADDIISQVHETVAEYH